MSLSACGSPWPWGIYVPLHVVEGAGKGGLAVVTDSELNLPQMLLFIFNQSMKEKVLTF